MNARKSDGMALAFATDGPPKEEWERAGRAAWIRNEANLPLGCFQLHLRLCFPPFRVFFLAPVSDYTAMSGAPFAAKRCTCSLRPASPGGEASSA